MNKTLKYACQGEASADIICRYAFWSAPLEAPLSAPCGPTLAPHAASHIRFSTPDTEARLCAPEGRSLRRFAFAVTCKRIEGEAACAPPRCIFACAYMSLTRSNPNADTRGCCYLVAFCYFRQAVSRQDSIGFRSRCHARAARRRGARRGGGAHGEGSHHRRRACGRACGAARARGLISFFF